MTQTQLEKMAEEYAKNYTYDNFEQRDAEIHYLAGAQAMNEAKADADVKPKAMDFYKLWDHNQGAVFLKQDENSLEMKKSLAHYFFRHGQQYGFESAQALKAIETEGE